MILILGAGYIGQAFARELTRRGLEFRTVSRGAYDYTRFGNLVELLREEDPYLLINAAGVTGQTVDTCESFKAETLLGNLVLPVTIADACRSKDIPWLHVSSGCVFDGPAPDGVAWKESDLTNFRFDARSSFYAATKELAERAIAHYERCWIARIRMPFDHVPHAKNLISKFLNYRFIYDSPPNSLSHLGDAVRACVDLWERSAHFGTYHVSNPGALTNRQIVGMIRETMKPAREFKFALDAEFYRDIALAPRSNCVLSSGKLLATGIPMRLVEEALTDSLRKWQNRSDVGS